MANMEIRLIIFFVAKDGEALYSQQKQDQELTVAQTNKRYCLCLRFQETLIFIKSPIGVYPLGSYFSTIIVSGEDKECKLQSIFVPKIINTITKEFSLTLN